MRPAVRVRAHGRRMIHARRTPPIDRDLLSRRLDREWAALRRRPRVLAEVRRWNLTVQPLTDLDELLAATGYRRPPTVGHNEALRRLLARARTDDLAARIVLQRILPGLLAAVRRRGRRHGPAGLFEELVGCAWISIRRARVGDESAHVAATLISDAVHRAFVAPRRRRSAREVTIEPGAFADHPDPDTTTPLEELAGLFREARERGLPAEDVELVRALMRWESTAGVAAVRNVTARTVRNHRDRAAYGIRRRTEVDPEAA